LQVQDKIGFMVNNLSHQNLEQKAEDLKKLLNAENWPWFANYMVVKRAAQEPNFHALYLQVCLISPSYSVKGVSS
jgi:CCR4-NOT transcription complex subunit 1